MNNPDLQAALTAIEHGVSSSEPVTVKHVLKHARVLAAEVRRLQSALVADAEDFVFICGQSDDSMVIESCRTRIDAISRLTDEQFPDV